MMGSSSLWGSGRRGGSRYEDPFSADTVTLLRDIKDTLKSTHKQMMEMAKTMGALVVSSDKIANKGETQEKTIKIINKDLLKTLNISGKLGSSFDKVFNGFEAGSSQLKDIVKGVWRIYSTIEEQNHRISVDFQKTTNTTLDEYTRHYKLSIKKVRELNSQIGAPIFSSTDYFDAANSLAQAGLNNIDTINELTATHLILSATIDGWTSRYGQLLGQLTLQFGVEQEAIIRLGGAINSLSELDGVLSYDLIEILDSQRASLNSIAKSTNDSFEGTAGHLMDAAAMYSQLFVNAGKILGKMKDLQQSTMGNWGSELYTALNVLGYGYRRV